MIKKAQSFQALSPAELIQSVQTCHDEGYRLVQISCTHDGDNYELTYSFDRDLALSHLRIRIPPETAIPSISRIYLAAFVYENEIADLFGIPITGIAIDYKGTFIRTKIPHPFGSPQVVKAGSKTEERDE
ncbi:MAG: NADH-quinone oxidoreductase subunit C [Methanospirillum sp.]|nr:NADH-quinone oxidoreductase subunit C [Methanospirillum sp.]